MSRPIKLRRRPIEIDAASDGKENGCKRPRHDLYEKKSVERLVIGDGRLNRLLDEILGPCGVASVVVDLILLFVISNLWQDNFVLSTTVIPPPSEKCIDTHWRRFQSFLDHVITQTISLEEWLNYGCVYGVITLNTNTGHLDVRYIGPFSRQMLYMFMSENERSFVKEQLKEDRISPDTPIIFMEYEDEPYTFRKYDFGDRQYFIPVNTGPYPCRSCDSK